MTKSLNLVQFTDPHLFGDPARSLRGVPTLPALQATLAAAAADIAAADIILATGDLVQDDPAGYAHFRAELGRFGKPVLCIPGNHDDVPAMRAALAEAPFHFGGVHDARGWRLVMLDSTVPGRTGGRLDEDEMAHLVQALGDAPDRHVLVCLHHHPLPMHSRWLDSVGLDNGPELLALLRDFPNVRGVVFGHVHQQEDRIVGGLRLIATPSTCSQFTPRSDDFAVDDRPPGWRTLQLQADGRIETAVHWVRNWQP